MEGWLRFSSSAARLMLRVSSSTFEGGQEIEIRFVHRSHLGKGRRDRAFILRQGEAEI